jgi:cytidylate kinase
MSTLGYIERYLQSHVKAFHYPKTEDGVEPTIHPFVTISRQAGARGHTLANTLIEMFEAQPEHEVFGGWQIFDQNLSEIVSSDPAFAKSLDTLLHEEYRTPTADVVHTALRSSLDQDYVMARVFRVVRILATMGKAIIVGRGGANVTRDLPMGVRLRLVAPEADRIAGVMSYYGLPEKEARSYAKKLDTGRARLIRTHFDADIDDPTTYDAIWNTGFASIDEIAETVVMLIRRRTGPFSGSV